MMAAITANPRPAHKGVTGALDSVKGAEAAAGDEEGGCKGAAGAWAVWGVTVGWAGAAKADAGGFISTLAWEAITVNLPTFPFTFTV